MKRLLLGAAALACAALPAQAVGRGHWSLDLFAHNGAGLHWEGGGDVGASMDCWGLGQPIRFATDFPVRGMGVHEHDGSYVDSQGRSEWPVRLTLTSGAVSSVFTAQAADREDGPPRIGVNTDTERDSPVWTAFARTGSLSASVGAVHRVFPRVSPADARRFVTSCRRYRGPVITGPLPGAE